MIINVPIDQIDYNPFQRRQDYGDIPALAADIQQHGLLQAPRGRLVYSHGEILTGAVSRGACLRIQDDGFPAGLRVQLAFGHRRLRAFIHNQMNDAGGWGEMPVAIEDFDDFAMLDAVWSENQHRSDINAIEQAELLAEKLERARAAGGNQETVAAEWGIDRSTLANRLRLLKLPEGVQMDVRAGRISERKALAMLPLNGNAAELESIAAQADELSSDEIRKYARRGPKSHPLSVGVEIPMLRHGGRPFVETDSARRLESAARVACNCCIQTIGPPNDLVCKECPGVTLIRHLGK